MSTLSVASVVSINAVEVFTKLDSYNLLAVAMVTITITVILLTCVWIRQYFIQKHPNDLSSIESGNKSDHWRIVNRIRPDHSIQEVNIDEENSGWAFDGEYYINKLSLIKFPQKFGQVLNLTSILIYDDLGENCSIGYQSIIPNFYVTAYIYKEHSNNLSDAFRTEIENIAASHPDLSIPSNQVFWGSDTETVGVNLNFADSSSISTALCYEEDATKVKSFIILTQLAGNYIKLRATWPNDSNFESKLALATLRGVIVDLTVFNKFDIFGIKLAVPA